MEVSEVNISYKMMMLNYFISTISRDSILDYYIEYKNEIKRDKKNVLEKKGSKFRKLNLRKDFNNHWLYRKNSCDYLQLIFLSNTLLCHCKMRMGHECIYLSLG